MGCPAHDHNADCPACRRSCQDCEADHAQDVHLRDYYDRQQQRAEHRRVAMPRVLLVVAFILIVVLFAL